MLNKILGYVRQRTEQPATFQQIAESIVQKNLRDFEAIVDSKIEGAFPVKAAHDNIFIPAIELYQTRHDDPFMKYSTCWSQDFLHPKFSEICQDLAHPAWFHRKLWEWAFILNAGRRYDLIKPGVRALGFGVGSERLPSVFAKYGMSVTGTDAPESIGIQNGWVETGQFAKTLQDLHIDSIIDKETFLERVTLAQCDMNDISPEFRGYDFCWSSSCLEHLGDLKAGMDFIINSVEKTLRVGGVACHLTEINLSSNENTIESGPTVIYRKRDVDELIGVLRSRGHVVEDFTLAPFFHPLDNYVDTAPYQNALHLKLKHEGYAMTSMGIVVQRGA